MTQQLDWIDGQPVSRRYGDVFFSRDSGIAEKRHVFLDGNMLAERFAALAPRSHFVIGETGFGTGLNFLAAWQLFEAAAARDTRLHFFSVEKHPLSSDDLRATLALWPELQDRARQLCAQWDHFAPGWHRFRFADGRVHLTLGAGDAADRLAEIDAPADAWFLDGFAPARNPDMWTREVFGEIARLSRAGTTLTTYTAAGEVKRELEAIGFATQKSAGFGRKRDMLRGDYRGAPIVGATKPWFARPPAHAGEREAIVIGAGLAGCAAADALAARGWRVTLLDQSGTIAGAASGNPQGVLYARLSAADTPVRRVVLSGYQHAIRRIAQTLPEGEDTWRRVGVLQLGFDADERARQEALAAAGFPPTLLTTATRENATELARMEVPSGGLYFSGGGWTHPPSLCRALADHEHIAVRASRITSIDRIDGGWHVCDADGTTRRAGVVVIAAAHESHALAPTRHLPLRTISGQITALPATPRSAALATVLCGKGYAAPARHGAHTIGATHRMREASTDMRVADHAANLAMLSALAPGLSDAADAARLDPAILTGRAGVRCTSPDTLPIVGPVIDADAFVRTYAPLPRDASLDLHDPTPCLPGLFVTTAHGSRGLVTTLLAGEILAALIEGEPPPDGRSVLDAVHPSRFLLRGLLRGRRPVS